MAEGVDTIRHSVFLMPVHDPNKPWMQCIDEDLEFVVRAEELGFSEFWIGEHHSSTLENIVMPEIFIGKALGLTKKIRLGPAPVCLQYHHPKNVANRLAFLDHLSHGRLILCFGPGAVPSDLELHGIDPQESGKMVGEAIDIILKLWTTDPPYDIKGQYWNVQLQKYVMPELGMGAIHKPLQKPHPPVSIPAIARNSFSLKRAGEMGFRPISHHMTSVPALANHWETYSNAAHAAGREPLRLDWSISRNIFVAHSTKEARRLARDSWMGKCIQYILDLTRRCGNIAMWKRDPEMSDDDCNLDYFMNEVVIAGDPDEVVRQLLQMMDVTGRFGTLVFTAHDWDDKEAWLRCIDLFALEVMPALNARLKAG